MENASVERATLILERATHWTGIITKRLQKRADSSPLQGEKCILKEPCQSLKKILSIIFIVDASQSIQVRNWPSVGGAFSHSLWLQLVDFLRSGASLLPNNVNVGFIKFATDVTFAKWLPTGWSTSQFQQIIPTDFDAGYTNTPAALGKAVEMFDVRDNEIIWSGQCFSKMVARSRWQFWSPTDYQWWMGRRTNRRGSLTP